MHRCVTALLLLLIFMVQEARGFDNKEVILFWPGDDYSENDFNLPYAVGSYTNGQLVNGMKINDQGVGYVVSNTRSRYATHFLISTIEYVTSEMRDRYPNYPRLIITSLSKKNGGHTPIHDSHQNGLDMDAIYLRKKGIPRPSYNERDLYERDFIENGEASKDLDIQRNFQLMHLFVKTGRVNAIFMDQSIKYALCEYAKVSGIPGFQNTLSKLRHWPNHATHFHLRLECPNSSKQCIKTYPPPVDMGCSARRGINRPGAR